MSTVPSITDLAAVWRTITTAGGIDAFVTSELTRRGVLVQRRETEGMSARELDQYKKLLKAEAEERRKVRREAWAAYKTTHVVHLGEGVFWTDKPASNGAAASGKAKGGDRFDLPDAEERAAENELPALDTPGQLAEALGLTIPQLRRLAYHRDAA